MCRLFAETEVRNTIMSFNNGKVLGPVGFTMLFYKKHWQIIKEDLMKFFHNFHRNCIINDNVNNTYIAFIGKKKKKTRCITPLDYRPISLTTSLYKIIAKTLANRIKSTLADTITKNQIAFIKGRQITDVILIPNEAIYFWRTKKIKGFVLKLDIEKAFDKIGWGFIDYMLLKKNFPNKWKSWIKACICNVQY